MQGAHCLSVHLYKSSLTLAKLAGVDRSWPWHAALVDVSALDLSELDLRDTVEAGRIPQLMDLYAEAWWTAGRTFDDVVRMVASCDLVFAFVHRAQDRLVGFARVLTDDTYYAMILDVIVAAPWRGRGLGAGLMNAIVGHPRLLGVQTIELVCQPDLISFYRRFGFTDQVGRSLLMRKTTNPVLAGG